jgi:hypothetical protein
MLACTLPTGRALGSDLLSQHRLAMSVWFLRSLANLPELKPDQWPIGVDERVEFGGQPDPRSAPCTGLKRRPERRRASNMAPI